MSDFTFVTCSETRREPQRDLHGKFRNFLEGVSDFLNTGGNEFELIPVQFEGQPGFFALVLPFDECELNGMGVHRAKRFRRRIARFCAEKNCGRLVVPLRISGIPVFQGPEYASFTGDYLYKALLVDIIREICLKRGIEVHRMDLAIICDKKDEFLFSVLHMLLPLVKYITVVAKEETPIEQIVSEIYGEYGVSVWVTNSFKSIKGADFAINLWSEPLPPYAGCTFSKAAVVNYGDRRIEDVMRESPIINGLGIKLPQEIISKLPPSFRNCYGSAETAEIILSLRSGTEKDVLDSKYGFKEMSRMANEFRNAGCKITGFVGRHGILKPEELIERPGRAEYS